MAFSMTRTIRCAVILGAAALYLAPAGALAATRAGVSAAVRGDVELTSVVTAQARPARGGEDVYLGDRVRTAQQSGMQLLLLDESTFTIGPEADLTVDKYVYDPASGAGELSASLTRGTLRFVSGKISRKTPQNVNIDLPVATVGVRGTIVTILPSDEGFYVILGGPSARNAALAQRGRVLVRAGGRLITLKRFGIGVLVHHDGSVEGPFRVPLNLRGQGPGTLTPGNGGLGDGVLFDRSRLAELMRLLDLLPKNMGQPGGPGAGPEQPGEITELVPDQLFNDLLHDVLVEYGGEYPWYWGERYFPFPGGQDAIIVDGPPKETCCD